MREMVAIPQLGELIVMSGYYQRTIARELTIDPALLSRWVRGALVPSMYLARLGELLACNWDVTLSGQALAVTLVVPLKPLATPPLEMVQSPPPPPRPLAADSRARLSFGFDATPMGPGQPIHCSCGKPVR
jgi:hypothetical protein